MNNEVFNKALKLLKDFCYNLKLSHSELLEKANVFLNLVLYQENIDTNSLNLNEIINNIVDEYEMQIGVTQKMPSFLSDADPLEWFQSRKSNCDFKYFNRYKEFLERNGFPEETTNVIKQSTEKILAFCADPKGSNILSETKKKGLVVGDVQSGKTSNYISLINMACDMGYKIIVLLAGLTTSLREQTQERIDEGFIGAKSDSISDEPIYFGVGITEENYYGIPLTNKSNDFVKFVRKNQNTGAQDYNKPIILVVKKNKSVLDSVATWLKPNQNNITSNNILIIDDEADNASVNTKSKFDDISAINEKIRMIFNNFKIASYVGYTATPFANIFINPFEKDPSNQDLFPSDFIVLLETPSNYFGFDKVFNKIDENKYEHIEIINEEDPYYLKTMHKKDTIICGIPGDLVDAILEFYLSNVIRTLRGDEYKHRSMLINVSRFNDIQKQIYEKVYQFNNMFLRTLKELNYLNDSEFLNNRYTKRIYELYMTDRIFEKARGQFNWKDIRSKLLDEVNKMQVIIINNSIKSEDRFKYDDYKDYGARVIVVGGLVLSRGLTLEGLMTSYFNRNSVAYDTLLQMCRWFGYRFKYDDLCKIYMTQLNVDSFEAVNDAVLNLKDQFKQLALSGKAPKDFGLMVKESPDTLETSLLVTARNKMADSQQIITVLNYSGYAVDTSKIFISHEKNLENYNNISELFSKLIKEGYKFDESSDKPLIKNVSKNFIPQFIRKIQIPYENTKFDKEGIADYIDSNNQFLNWDIVIAEGSCKETINIFNKEVKPSLRKFDFNEGEDFYRISGNKNRLFEPSIFKYGLTIDEIEKIKKVKETPIVADYLKIKDRNPIFIIYPVKLKIEDNKENMVDLINESECNGAVYGFALGFPFTEDGVKLSYRANKIKIDQLRKAYEEDYDEEDCDND